jgi:hypothetical protein
MLVVVVRSVHFFIVTNLHAAIFDELATLNSL